MHPVAAAYPAPSVDSSVGSATEEVRHMQRRWLTDETAPEEGPEGDAQEMVEQPQLQAVSGDEAWDSLGVAGATRDAAHVDERYPGSGPQQWRQRRRRQQRSGRQRRQRIR